MPADGNPSAFAAASAHSPVGPGVLMMISEKPSRSSQSKICSTGGKLNRCNSYSGSSNSPIGSKFLSGTPWSATSDRQVTIVTSCPEATPAAAILRIVVATPFTSSSVSVNHARFLFPKNPGTRPARPCAVSRSHSRFGNRNAWIYGLSNATIGKRGITVWMLSRNFPREICWMNSVTKR